ncbi:MAG: glycosyltransferase [Pyrinomonadaceae bacterium]
MPMRLTVIVTTYNRKELLDRNLASLLAAPIPAGLEVRVAVADNNSNDGTAELVTEWQPRFTGRLDYIFEPVQGKSKALNTAIAATDSDLVATIDDDEEIETTWFQTIAENFTDPSVDYIGGPCLPRWEAESPDWLPQNYRGVVGWVESGSQRLPFDDDFPGMLMGGNAVMRRATLERVGGFSTALGRTDTRLLSGEDEDLYQRLRDTGARGYFVPELIIHHFVPRARLTRRYFRRWCFWRGVSQGLMDRDRQAPVKYLLGIPRWLFGTAARGAWAKLKGLLPTSVDQARTFGGELDVITLMGFFYGKHWYRPERTS